MKANINGYIAIFQNCWYSIMYFFEHSLLLDNFCEALPLFLQYALIIFESLKMISSLK